MHRGQATEPLKMQKAAQISGGRYRRPGKGNVGALAVAQDIGQVRLKQSVDACSTTAHVAFNNLTYVEPGVLQQCPRRRCQSLAML